MIMSNFFNDTMTGLLEAVAIDRGEIPLVEKENMPSKTLVSSEWQAKELVENLQEIRKEKNITQGKLAEIMGTKQQVISRMENNENVPTLKFFCSALDALGYELQIVKKVNNA